jgi:hypothetical protein
VFPEVMVGMIDASTTRRPPNWRTRAPQAAVSQPRRRCEGDEFLPPHGAYPKAKDHELIIAPCIAAKSRRSCPEWVRVGHSAMSA